MNFRRQTLHSARRTENYGNMGGPKAFGRRSNVPGGIRAFRCAVLLGDDPDKLELLRRITPKAISGVMDALRRAARKYDRGAANDLLQEAHRSEYVFEQVREAIGRETDSADRTNLEACEHTAFMAITFRVVAKGKDFSREVFSACIKEAEKGGRGALEHYLRAYRVAETAGMIDKRNKAKAKFIEECEVQKAYSVGAKAVKDHRWDQGGGKIQETFAKWALAAEWEGKELQARLERQMPAIA